MGLLALKIESSVLSLRSALLFRLASMRQFGLYMAAVFLALPVQSMTAADPMLSSSRQEDPTAKTLAEIRDADKRRIPLEVALKTSNQYVAGNPIQVTVMVTNLFD